MAKYITIAMLLLALVGIYSFGFFSSAQPPEKYMTVPTMPTMSPKEVNITHVLPPIPIDALPSAVTTPLPSPTPIIYKIKINPTTYVDKIPYDTHCNQQKLSELKGKKIALILYEYNNSMLKSSEDIAPSTSQIILDYQKNKFLSEFGSLFKIEDISNNSQVLKECSSINEILQEIGADGGILITNDYGYKMSSNLLQGIWEQVLPKDFVRVGFGSNVENYYLASNTYIIDEEGKVIWNFYGKVSASPEFEFTIGEIVGGIVGGDPYEQKIMDDMTPITGHYTEYIRWLVETDLNGTSNKSYSDYPRRGKGIWISPASNDRRFPFVYDAPQRQYESSTPGFEVVFAITGLLAVAYLLRRKK